MALSKETSSFKTEKRRIDPSLRRRETLERLETRERQRITALSAILNVMIKAVQKAGRNMIRDFGEVSQLQVTKKGPGDFVSNADIMAEKILIESLSEDRPDYGIISEEKGSVPAKNGSPFTWIIDPIDGTTNFIHAIPYFAISVALREHDDIVAAVLFNPITNELYYAEKGQGAFLMTPSGSKRLRVSGRSQPGDCLFGLTGFNEIGKKELLEKFAGRVAGIRHMGSTTLELASVAAGQLDAFITKGANLWDIAASYLFIREAGGKIATLSGKTGLQDLIKSEYIIASNLSLMATIQKGLAKKDVQ